MRILQSSVFRAIIAVIIGALLIKYPDNTVKGITVAIGILFLVSGLISCVAYYHAKRHVSEYKIYDAEGRLVAGEQPTFPLVGLGSMILGFILALTPTSFVSALMYIIGAILILGAINQYLNLWGGRRYGHVSWAFWIMPTTILLVGIYVILKPMAPLSMAMYILGWCTLLYGVTELINALKFYSDKKKLKRVQDIQEAEVVSDTEAEAAEVVEAEEAEAVTPPTLP